MKKLLLFLLNRHINKLEKERCKLIWYFSLTIALNLTNESNVTVKIREIDEEINHLLESYRIIKGSD